jgi:outer membrane protein TolC
MVFLKRRLLRHARIPLFQTIQFSSALLLTGCASSIDATKDVQSAQLLASERLPVLIDASLVWNASDPLTVESAITYAITHDALLQRDFSIIVQRRAEIAQAELPANPTFGGAVGIAVDGLAGAPLIFQGIQNLSWLWTRPERIAAAEQTLQQAILTAANRTIEVVSKVRQAHFEVSTQMKLVALAQEDVQLAKDAYAITQEHAMVGEASELTLDNTNVSLLEARYARKEQQELFDFAVFILLRTMGCPETTNIFAIIPQQSPEQIRESEESLFSFALDNRLDLATQKAVIQQRSAELGLANPPLVSASVMFNENFSGRQAILPGGEITIALDGDAKEAVAQSKLKQAELTYIDSMRTIVFDVRKLYKAYANSIDRLAIDERVVLATQNALQRALEANNRGELDPLALIPIKRDLIRVKQLALLDGLAVAINSIQLEQAVGGTFKGIEQ